MKFCPGRPPAGQTATGQPGQPASPGLPRARELLGAHGALSTVLSVEMQNNTEGNINSPGGAAYSQVIEAGINQEPHEQSRN